jgi:hypothetical protein
MGIQMARNSYFGDRNRTKWHVRVTLPKSRGAQLPKGASKSSSTRTDDVSSTISASDTSLRDT